MSTITFADLEAIAIDTASLPPMRGGKGGSVRKTDRKRAASVKRETLARRQARALKTAV